MTDVLEPLIDAQLAAPVECSTDAIVCLALDGTITSWNRAAERMYLYLADEVLGEHVSLEQVLANLVDNAVRQMAGRSSRCV